MLDVADLPPTARPPGVTGRAMAASDRPGRASRSSGKVTSAGFPAHMPPPMAGTWATVAQPRFDAYLAGIRGAG